MNEAITLAFNEYLPQTEPLTLSPIQQQRRPVLAVRYRLNGPWPAYAEAEGAALDGCGERRTTFNFLSSLSDTTSDPRMWLTVRLAILTDGPAKEMLLRRCALHLIQTMENFGWKSSRNASPMIR